MGNESTAAASGFLRKICSLKSVLRLFLLQRLWRLPPPEISSLAAPAVVVKREPAAAAAAAAETSRSIPLPPFIEQYRNSAVAVDPAVAGAKGSLAISNPYYINYALTEIEKERVRVRVGESKFEEVCDFV
jgi:hypothetical protein